MDDSTLVAGISPARVERGFAFVDLCNFTRFTDDHGDRKAVALLAEFRAGVRAVAASHGVRIAKWLGDGAMLVCVENEPLVEAVVHLKKVVVAQGVLPLRAGMAAGPVILFEGDDYIGEPVNLAAKLCAAAHPDQILAVAEPADLPDWVISEDNVTVRIKGVGAIGGVRRLRPNLSERS